MNRRKPSTEVLLLLAGAFTGPVGAATLVALIAAAAAVPGLAFTPVRSYTTAGAPTLALGLEAGEVGAPFPPPVATFQDVVKRENLEGAPSASDIRRARAANRKTNRRLVANPYFRLYKIAKRRFGVSWYLVASVHYQKRNAASHPRAAASAIGSGLFRKGLGSASAWQRRRHAYRGAVRPRRYPHRSAIHPSVNDDFDVIMAAAAELKAAGARSLGPAAWQALYALYGRDTTASSYATTVLERARAWKQLGIVPLPGNGELALPVAGSVPGCGYFHCPRPGHLHNGLDLSAPAATPIHAADAGTVALIEGTGESSGYGNFICIQHRAHLATCYAHLSAFAAGLAVGIHVDRGQVIGLVGSTGHSTGAHLHFEVRRGPAACMECAVDPATYVSGQVPDAPLPEFDAALGPGKDPSRRRESAANRARHKTKRSPVIPDRSGEPSGSEQRRPPEPMIQVPPAQTTPAPDTPAPAPVAVPPAPPPPPSVPAPPASVPAPPVPPPSVPPAPAPASVPPPPPPPAVTDPEPVTGPEPAPPAAAGAPPAGP